MAAGLIASVVAPHTPRIGIEANAPEFARGLIGGLRELGEELRALKPDLFVLMSSHWVSTFTWYVTTHARHEGYCIADEAPDLIPGVKYQRTGDPQFAEKIATTLEGAGIPCGRNDSPHFNWDYGSFVPLQYIDPKGEVPVVLMPSVICSELEECTRVGALIHQAAQDAGKRVIFIASSALSHQVLRGPENWPLEEHQALDRQFMEMVQQAKVRELAAWTPGFCRQAVGEMGGRPVSGMVGAAEAMAAAGAKIEGRQFGPYGQSSGSGNVSLALFARGA